MPAYAGSESWGACPKAGVRCAAILLSMRVCWPPSTSGPWKDELGGKLVTLPVECLQRLALLVGAGCVWFRLADGADDRERLVSGRHSRGLSGRRRAGGRRRRSRRSDMPIGHQGDLRRVARVTRRWLAPSQVRPPSGIWNPMLARGLVFGELDAFASERRVRNLDRRVQPFRRGMVPCAYAT
jgi:hypothetical protein